MNSKTSFRISSIVLTVACMLCGITTASYLVAPPAPYRNAVVQKKIADNPQQVRLSELHPNPGQSSARSHQPPDAVQPVTVNIDIAGMIREISRVHERLDSLSAEAALAQSRASHHEALATADSAVVVAVTHPTVSVPEPMPEILFEMTPDQVVADIPIAQPPTLVPEDTEPVKLPVSEFSTGVLAIPNPNEALANVTQNHEQFFEFADLVAEDPIAPGGAPVPVQWPALPGVAMLAVPSSQSAKRTTDPPFMNGRSRPGPAPPTPVANEPIGATHRISHRVHAPGKHTSYSDCQKCAVANQAANPAYRTQRVTPSRAFQWIESALSH